jgi:uncharacterized membrane protein YphA (DoxX/SURF4 family)
LLKNEVREDLQKLACLSLNFLGPFVGFFEIVCGAFILFGLPTRLAAMPLSIIMLVAIATTKAQLLADNGFWSMLHDSRTDWSMLLEVYFC